MHWLQTGISPYPSRRVTTAGITPLEAAPTRANKSNHHSNEAGMTTIAMSLRAGAMAVLMIGSCWRAADVAGQTPSSAREHQIFADRTFDPAVPAPGQALGYALGEDLATYASMVPYFERLAASSGRVKFDRHGESYEGRPIYHLAISSPENLARLDQIRANIEKLADPRKLSGQQEAEDIIRNTPAIVMLVFATDGAETAAPEAAIQMAYQLSAATDARTTAMLKDAVVIIVPAQNPDANQRAVAWYKAFRVGPDGTADPDAAEHYFPWGINSNNRYQVDPNRESVWSSLRETRAMVAFYRQWNPQVFVDNHGEYSVYTGAWYAEPLHEVLTEHQLQWHRRFGEAMQAEFTKHGYAYSPWDYGQFDPGYWDTYPNFSGAIAWTTETTGGGRRGLRMDRRDGATFTLADAIIQHMIASDATIELAAQNRTQLLRDFLDYKRSAIEEGLRGPVKAYAISANNDPRTLASVVNTLGRNAIEVHQTTHAITSEGARAYFQPGGSGRPAPENVTLPAGSYIISTAQPESRMLRVLMEPEASFSEAFLAQVAKSRADGDVSDLFYDVTAWSMPHTYNLEAYELADQVPASALERVTGEVVLRGAVIRPEAGHAFLIDYSSNSAIQAMGRLRRDGVVFHIAPESFSSSGRSFAAGTIAIFRSENPGRDLTDLARTLADESGVTLVGVDGPATTTGFRLEPGRMVPANTGAIAVVMDRPVYPSSYGHIWFTFEQLYGIDFTALNFDRLASVNLEKYSVLILPDGNYGGVHKAVAADIAGRLRSWVEKGGTLIGIRGAATWITAEGNNLTAARMRDSSDDDDSRPVVPGTIFRAEVTDARHPLVRGYSTEFPVMVWSSLAFDPDAAVEAPVHIADAARARISGFAFPESVDHLAGTPYVVRDRKGSGSVILFLDDPNFRLYWDGLTRLFFNAVFLGGDRVSSAPDLPVHPTPRRSAAPVPPSGE